MCMHVCVCMHMWVHGSWVGEEYSATWTYNLYGNVYGEGHFAIWILSRALNSAWVGGGGAGWDGAAECFWEDIQSMTLNRNLS